MSFLPARRRSEVVRYIDPVPEVPPEPIPLRREVAVKWDDAVTRQTVTLFLRGDDRALPLLVTALEASPAALNVRMIT